MWWIFCDLHLRVYICSMTAPWVARHLPYPYWSSFQTFVSMYRRQPVSSQHVLAQWWAQMVRKQHPLCTPRGRHEVVWGQGSKVAELQSHLCQSISWKLSIGKSRANCNVKIRRHSAPSCCNGMSLGPFFQNRHKEFLRHTSHKASPPKKKNKTQTLFLDRAQSWDWMCRVPAVTPCGLLFPQILTLYRLTRPDRWKVDSSLNTVSAVQSWTSSSFERTSL
jgi:hypothetical protein